MQVLILLDFAICIIAFALSGFSWIYFLKTFNWEDIFFSAVFMPSVLVA